MNVETSAHGCDVTEELRHRREEVEQLREALRSRAVIDQAKGILMERFGISSDRAFALLSRVSQVQNRKVRLLAEVLADDVAAAHADRADSTVDVSMFDAGRAKDPRGSAE